MKKNHIILNDNEIDISISDPNSSLLDWIRLEKQLHGTKEGCAEGDCGACSILLSPVNGGKLRPANSCLLKLGQVVGSSVYTVEGLGSKKLPSPIQKSLTKYGGSQCGFCTPGFVIAITSLLNHKEKPTEIDIHDALAGNLCRCTGYRPIVEAIEKIDGDIHLPECSKWSKCMNSKSETASFFYPVSVEEAYELSYKNDNTFYLSGGTDLNLSEISPNIKPNYILLNRIPSLNKIHEKNNEIHIGASVTLEDTLPYFEKFFPPFAEIIRRFGSSQIRSQATIAGNLCTASPIGDTAPSLMALGASVEIFSNKKFKYLAVEDLFTDYRKTVLNPNDIITSIIIPLPEKEKFYYAWKVSKRHDQDISTTSIGALVSINKNKVIQSCRICFGGLSATPLRNRKLEDTLIGKDINFAMNEAERVTKKTIKPLSDLRGSSDYRADLAVGLVKRLLLSLSNQKLNLEVTRVQ